MCLALPHFLLMIEINQADKIETKLSLLRCSSSESVNIVFTLKTFFNKVKFLVRVNWKIRGWLIVRDLSTPLN